MRRKNKIILLVVIGILLATSITVFMVTKNKTQAVEGTCKHTNTKANKYTEKEHRIYCYDCEAVLRDESHKYEDGQCTICGNTDPAVCKHTKRITSIYDEKEHLIECLACRTMNIEAHTLKDGRCTECGYTDPEICEHTRRGTYSEDGEKHYIRCEECRTRIRL